MEGKLQLYAGEPAWAAVLGSGDRCAKLALPDGFYADAKQRNGQRVRVLGHAFEQPAFDESNEMTVLWYTEQDRKLARGICDHGTGVYVESMRLKSGREWAAPTGNETQE